MARRASTKGRSCRTARRVERSFSHPTVSCPGQPACCLRFPALSHRTDRGAVGSVFAVPPMAVVEHQVRLRRAVHPLFHAEDLLNPRARSADLFRNELTNPDLSPLHGGSTRSGASTSFRRLLRT